MITQTRIVQTRNIDDHTISFYSARKKSHYNLSKLYKELTFQICDLNVRNSCHLTVYPYIAVHVTNKDSDYLERNYDLIKQTVESTLFEMIEML